MLIEANNGKKQSDVLCYGGESMKKYVKTIISLFLMLFVMVGCSKNESASLNSTSEEENVTKEEKVITVATPDPWVGLCPMSSTTDAQVVFSYPVFDACVTASTDGKAEARLFESWEQSEDGTVITCHLNQNSTWHDGEKVTADDVIFSMMTMMNPEVPLDASRSQFFFKFLIGTESDGTYTNVDEVGLKAIDDYTVEFTYKPENVTTIENFLFGLRSIFIYPEHLLKDIPAESLLTDAFWENPVGSGPFKLDNIVSGERMEYVAFEDYYLGRPEMDRLIIRVIPSNNILSAMLAGEVDVTAYGSLMTLSDYEQAKANSDLVTNEIPGFGNQHILLNNETLDINVRKAIDYAVDKETIINDLLHGYGRTAISAIVPENPYRLGDIEGNAYNPEKAKELLTAAGWDSTRTLRCLTYSTSELGQNIAVLVQQQLAEVGINIEIETYDRATISSKFYDGEYDLGIAQSASNPFEPSESRFYFQLVPNGWLRMTDSSWIELYDEGAKGLTVEERRPSYDELQRRLVEEVPMVFLFHEDQLFVNSQRISNIPYEIFKLRGWKYWEWNVE